MKVLTPVRVRGAVWGVLALVLWVQLGRLAALTRAIGLARDRARVVAEVSKLEGQLFDTLARFPGSAAQDAAWWRQRLAEGVRMQRLDVGAIEVGRAGLAVGPYQPAQLSLTVTGRYADVVQLVSWLETGKPRCRVVSVAIQPGKRGGVCAALAVQVPVLAVGAMP